MTKEEQKLLTIDLSARLPYGVKLLYDVGEDQIVGVLDEIIILSENHTLVNFSTVPENYDNPSYLEYFKPYLRSMEDMTEEEENEYERIVRGSLSNHLDWLNEHHFDYRCLIEKGLALQAPEDMYK